MHVPQTEVILRNGGEELARMTLPPGEYVIGREAKADICVPTPLISRRHALLTINYDHLLIKDLGSSNGTFINETSVSEETRLFPNQTVRLGDVVVEIRRHRAPTEPGVSLPPAQQAIRRFLPDELLAEKRYDIGQMIARGGMGAILNATQTATHRTVAMKVMLDVRSDQEVLRFIEEAQITAQLDHPNIVPIYELGVDEQDQLFYTMKMVRGITLQKVIELLAKGVQETVKKYPLTALLTIFQKVCDAVAFAHSKGVLHRDLKPENIMLGDFGTVLVMDWGLAKVLAKRDEDSALLRTAVRSVRVAESDIGGTMAGSVMGTPQYMAPEQAEGEIESLDERTDIYALGAILFAVLHLRPPITGKTVTQVLDKVTRGDLDWTPREGTHLPESLVSICRKALSLDPEKRYQRAEQLQADVAAHQNGFITTAEKSNAWKQLTLLIKRNKTASLGIAAVLLTGAIFGTNAFFEARRAEKAAARAMAESMRAELALADLKKTAPALFQLANSEANLQHFESALEKLDAARSLAPEDKASLWKRAWILVAEGKFADARDAAHVAQQKDPDSPNAAAIPLLEKIASLRPGEEWTGDLADQLLRHLESAGATGEVIALSGHLKRDSAGQAKLVKDRLIQWLGPTAGKFLTVSDQGLIFVDISRSAISTLDPLRGLPIDTLNIGGNPITSVEPLVGMPLSQLIARDTKLEDISPLRGMRLKKLDIYSAQVKNLEPLRGMPLEEFVGGNLKLSDFSALEGIALKKLDIPLNDIRDLRFVSKMPLESLKVGANQITDISPLRGKNFRILNFGLNPVNDISPLRGSAIEDLELTLRGDMDLRPLLDVRNLARIQLGISPSLPHSNLLLEPLRHHSSLKTISISGLPPISMEEFWAKHDAEQIGGKKP